MNAERRLTKDEAKRTDKFLKTVSEFETKGYSYKLITGSILRTNLYSMLVAIPLILLLVILFVYENREIHISYSFLKLFLAYIVSIILSFFHELIHGLCFALFAKTGFKSVSFGFVKEYLTIYFSCDEPLKKSSYLISTLMPVILLGVLPSLIAVYTNNFILLIIGVLMILGSGGDILISLKLLNYHSNKKDVIYLDHPTEKGLAIFEK